MKRFSIFAAVLLLSTSAYAGVVQPLGAASQVLIPAAGSTAGANGTFFRSDISIINLASHDQTVVLQWLPQAGAGGSNSTTTITLPALTGTRSADFVNQYLNQTGLGSIIVTGTANGVVDSTARLYVSSRIWSPEPGTSGTTSQSFPAIPMNTINTQIAALFAVGGADNPANYRVNVGVVNVDPSQAQTFVVQLLNPVGNPISQTITLPPMSMQQISVGNGVTTSSQIQIQNVTSSPARSNLWTAYSSTIDNVTGDAWSELAVVGTVP